MAEVVLYHHPRCPYARRTRLVLEHLQIPYEAVEVDLENVPSDFERVSAYGLVPAIVHRGANLYESNIINEYLDEVYNGGLMPERPLERARIRILMSYADNYWMPAVHELKMAARRGFSKDHVRDLQAHLLRRLREIETRFTGPGPYLTGLALTLADVAFATTITELPAYGMHIPDRLERTKRWAEALEALPAMQRVPTETPVMEREGH